MYSEAEIEAVKAAALLHELQPAPNKGRNVYFCPSPSCGHARVVKPTAGGIWYCQNCGQKGDVFTVVRLRDGVTHEQAFADVMNRYGHGQTVNGPTVAAVANRTAVVEQADGDGDKQSQTDAWRAECRRYLTAAAAALPGSPGEEYMHGRGFTLDTLQRFRVGYDARAKVHGVLKFGRAAVVYPYSRTLDYYAARFLKPIVINGDTRKAMMPAKTLAGDEPLFNAAALYGCEAVVVVEGAFDAMAVAQGAASIGANVGAVALCGTSCGRLIDKLKEKPTAARLFIALDNDAPGRAGALAAAAKLDSIGQRYELMDSEALFAGCKDAGEVLQQYGTDGAMALIDVLDAPEAHVDIDELMQRVQTDATAAQMQR